ncbi:Predicted dehydrogenase [Enhydrobacter aerosaccus]|uniref:Predicted dehydrogenase n=1 Tax=Enhydrobacter aerosaccus TaxID=225324 RepID=A0A1T4JZY3_9HYPH|nr:Gfo/Idh/MocA family oxidoreductase [Enhydrobacter aerosaccus]SJZ35812.1 Predicted dehydrogenase [Enhydrobacter aerosaccus]
MMIRIGILGAGAMASAHMAAYAGCSGAKVVAVFSPTPGRAEAIATAGNAVATVDARRLIETSDIDAIDVCVPTPAHCPFVLSALDHGKHIFCETPLTPAMEEALAMRAAARRADRLLQVGLLMRSVSAYQHLKTAVESGQHGRLLDLSTWRLGSYLRPESAHHKPHYGHPAVELMTFDFDVVNWLLGMPDRLNAEEIDGDVVARLGYGDGRCATVTASGMRSPETPFTVGFRARFDDAVFELETMFEGGYPRSTFTMSKGSDASQPVATPNRNPYEVELRHFLACIDGQGDPSLLDVERAIEALTLSLATQNTTADPPSANVVPP